MEARMRTRAIQGQVVFPGARERLGGKIVKWGQGVNEPLTSPGGVLIVHPYKDKASGPSEDTPMRHRAVARRQTPDALPG